MADGDIRNRAFTVPAAGSAVFTGVVEGWRSSASPPKRHPASRSVSILNDSFPIPQLGRTRRIWLYLPPDYARSKKRHPVLDMHDGQNVFDEATDFAGEWGVDETLDRLQRRGDRGAIVVAVDNGGSHRMDEYDPWVNPKKELGGGEGDAYVEFLVHTLKPYDDGISALLLRQRRVRDEGGTARARPAPDGRHATRGGRLGAQRSTGARAGRRQAFRMVLAPRVSGGVPVAVRLGSSVAR
jgi:hypothetical protein